MTPDAEQINSCGAAGQEPVALRDLPKRLG